MKKKIYFVTSNAGKVANADTALRPFGIAVEQININLIESRSEDSAEIALEKARQAYAECGKPLIVEDSGFFIKALCGFPMTHIKFSLKTIGIKNIITILQDVTDRRAEWRMTLAYVLGKNKFHSFTFIEKGEIARQIRPIKRPMTSDYWRIYIPKMVKGNTRALSKMTADDLNAWQNYYARHNQFQILGRWINKQ
jgi:XTP/dITP diphosphohydrolase